MISTTNFTTIELHHQQYETIINNIESYNFLCLIFYTKHQEPLLLNDHMYYKNINIKKRGKVMELSYLKTLWLKIIACFCASSQSELTQEPNSTVSQSSSAQQENLVEQTPSENNQKRMFNGALSTKEQGQLFLGIEQADKKIIENAIKNGADINQSINCLDPLQCAINSGKKEIVELVIMLGAEIQKHHIEQAEWNQVLYQSNLVDNDMIFPQAAKGEDKSMILRNKIRQYHIIETILKSKKEEQNKTSQPNKTKLSSTNSSDQKTQSRNNQNDDDE